MDAFTVFTHVSIVDNSLSVSVLVWLLVVVEGKVAMGMSASLALAGRLKWSYDVPKVPCSPCLSPAPASCLSRTRCSNVSKRASSRFRLRFRVVVSRLRKAKDDRSVESACMVSISSAAWLRPLALLTGRSEPDCSGASLSLSVCCADDGWALSAPYKVGCTMVNELDGLRGTLLGGF